MTPRIRIAGGAARLLGRDVGEADRTDRSTSSSIPSTENSEAVPALFERQEACVSQHCAHPSLNLFLVNYMMSILGGTRTWKLESVIMYTSETTLHAQNRFERKVATMQKFMQGVLPLFLFRKSAHPARQAAEPEAVQQLRM